MKYLVAFALLMSLFACKTEITTAEKPADLIPEDTMILVLKDLAVMDAHISNKYPPHLIKNEVISNSGDTILANYNLHFERWTNSMKYYIANQDEMITINKKVLESMEQQAKETAN